jgi:ribosomal protein S12 methylthiotransferase accessory factor
MRPENFQMIAQPQDEQLQRLLDLVSPKVGVLRSLSKIVRGVEEPTPPIIYQATLSHFDYRTAPAEERAAAGKGLTEDQAMRAAIGEAIEHYCAAHINNEISRLASWAELGDRGISPPECVLYSETQYARKGFPYHRWNPEDKVTWTPMRELPGGQEIFAPTSLVYLSGAAPRPEDMFTLSTSNGLAAGPSLEFAILNGLYELIERDGFLITWMNKLPAPRVDFASMGGLAESISTHYEKFDTEVRVYNLTTDLPVYVMMGVALDKSGEGPAVLVGLGCHLDPQVAVLKSLLEVCQVHPGEVRRFKDEPPDKRLKSYEEVRTLNDHSAFLMPLERIDEFAFLFENGRRQLLEDLSNLSQGQLEADLNTCVNSLVAAGCRVAYADLTTSDIVDFGLRVVRTIATGLQPMHFGFGEERLGGHRLLEVPQKLGYANGLRTERDLNPCPHPLA